MTKITLDKTSLKLSPGGAPELLQASVEPIQGGSTELAWFLQRNGAVDQNGLVTPVSAGSGDNRPEQGWLRISGSTG